MSWEERGRILLLAVAYPVVALVLRLTTYQRVITLLENATKRERPRRGVSIPPERIAELAEMSSKVTFPRPNCLQRSVVLWWALRTQGWESEIRFGVRKRPGDGGFDFHAWIERNGQVMNDHPDIDEAFTPLTTTADLPPEARLV